MRNNKNTERESTLRLSPRSVGVIMIVLALLLPFGYALDLGPGPNSIVALTWDYIKAPWQSGFGFVPIGVLLSSLLYTFPRFYFINRLTRFYRSEASQLSVILAGLASELFLALVSGFTYIGWQMGWTQPPPPSDHWLPIYVPIPALLVVGLLFMFLAPHLSQKARD